MRNKTSRKTAIEAVIMPALAAALRYNDASVWPSDLGSAERTSSDESPLLLEHDEVGMNSVEFSHCRAATGVVRVGTSIETEDVEVGFSLHVCSIPSASNTPKR
jgi:hypothetical protein